MTLSVNAISHLYKNATNGPQILDDVSFGMQAGEQLLLRGISGSGKTTLINIVAGLMTPSQGEIVVNEQSIYAFGEAARDEWRRSHVGYVFQTHHLLPLLNAWENVALPLAAGGVGRSQQRAQATELLSQVGLGEFVDYRPNQLSTGQRQRVALARALINKPALILADEPTASLDADAATIALDLLQNACRDMGTILIVASHDPALDHRFGRIADLEYGKWTELKRSSQSTTV